MEIKQNILNNDQVIEEIKREIKRLLETNDYEKMTTWNLWEAAKAIVRRKFIAIRSYFREQQRYQIDN